MEKLISRRSFTALAVTSLAAPAFLRPADASEAPVLVELFTSQGCSDCPPADKLAAELSHMPGVQVVSLNVDYWDYLGWKDTLAKPQYSKRQMDYAHARGDNDVYTPQMVVGGSAHAVGSQRGAVEAAIARARGAATVPVSVAKSSGDLEIKIGAGASQPATLWVMGVAPQVSVPIKRGENTGREITYHNVVRQLVEVGSWNGAAQSFMLATAKVAMPDCKSTIAVLQAGRVGPVLGFATLAI